MAGPTTSPSFAAAKEGREAAGNRPRLNPSLPCRLPSTRANDRRPHQGPAPRGKMGLTERAGGPTAPPLVVALALSFAPGGRVARAGTAGRLGSAARRVVRAWRSRRHGGRPERGRAWPRRSKGTGGQPTPARHMPHAGRVGCDPDGPGSTGRRKRARKTFAVPSPRLSVQQCEFSVALSHDKQ